MQERSPPQGWTSSLRGLRDREGSRAVLFKSSDKNTSAITLLPSACAAAPAQRSPNLLRVAAAISVLRPPDTFSPRISSLNYGSVKIEPELKPLVLHKDFIFLGSL